MRCINCGHESEQRLCQKCRDTAPYSNEELDSFLQLLKLFGGPNDEKESEPGGKP